MKQRAGSLKRTIKFQTSSETDKERRKRAHVTVVRNKRGHRRI